MANDTWFARGYEAFTRGDSWLAPMSIHSSFNSKGRVRRNRRLERYRAEYLDGWMAAEREAGMQPDTR